MTALRPDIGPALQCHASGLLRLGMPEKGETKSGFSPRELPVRILSSDPEPVQGWEPPSLCCTVALRALASRSWVPPSSSPHLLLRGCGQDDWWPR